MTRLLLTVACLALAVSAYALMRRGWRARVQRQSDLPEPPVAAPGAVTLVGPVPGLVVGTTAAEHWLDRVAVHHLSDRASGGLSIAEDGVHLERSGLPELFVPWDAVESVDVETALGGKVVSTGMLLLTWRLGGHRLRTAFRADDRAEHGALRDLIDARLHREVV
jgi:hypothetical protein